MNFFKQKSDEHSNNTQESKCLCHGKQGIFFDKRQTSRIVALLLLIAVFVFVGGYFWGQRVAIDQLLNTIERDSFADQIYYSMNSLYDQKDGESGDGDSGEDEAESQNESGDEGVVESTVKKSSGAPVQSVPAEQKKNELSSATQKHEKKYYAQLAGFGAQKSAQQLVNQLARRGITVKILKKQSKTARGKVVVWYQVVTKDFSDPQELNALLATIKKHEKLHDMRVVQHQ
jgi:hypothetical protein